MTTASDSIDTRIQALQQEIQEKQKALTALRRERPAEAVSDYTLKSATGDVSLSALFGDKRDLIVVHNMGRSCPYCTLWADGFNGLAAHLEDRAAFALCSPDEPGVQSAFASGRGWRFRMVSSADSPFTTDMGYAFEKEGKTWQVPGYSTFRKHDDGTITRIAHDSFGPGDAYCGLWHMFEHLDGGTGDWQPKFQYD